MRNIKWLVLLAAVIVLAGFGCERKITGNVELANNASSGCFQCHGDQDLKLVEAQIQYENSVHAAGEHTDNNRLTNSYYSSCEKCHTSEGFIANLTGEPADGNNFTAIKCFTCHAPHTNGNLTVRVTSAVSLADGTTFDRGPANLCASCHQSRRDVNTYVVDDVELDGHWGPHHSVQADMIIGVNSYEYSDYAYTKSAHSLAPKACIHCHMSASMHESIGGHSWNMRNEERQFENIAGCNVPECHDGTISTLNVLAQDDFDGDGDTTGIQTEVHNLLDSLQSLLLTAGLLEWSAEDSQYVPDSGRVVSTADSAGALYNWLFVKEDRSFGVHNTDYAVGLLQSSINFLEFGDPSPAPAAPRPKLFSAH
jgi:hypothetical protein